MAAAEILLYEGAEALIYLLQNASGKKMYLEFENVESAEIEVTVPTLARADGISYYQDQADSDCQDFLRVDAYIVGKSSSDETKYLTGNKLQIQGTSSGTEGIHGKPFSHTAISKVFGCAIVLETDPTDWTKDLVIARYTLATDNHVVKKQNIPVALSGPLTLN